LYTQAGALQILSTSSCDLGFIVSGKILVAVEVFE
jgi:hypothetical protein